MSVRVVRLDLGFVGTRYEGWQSQGRGKAIQEVLERALGKICGHKVSAIGSSRTDAGVHAEHFVASFKTRSAISGAVLVRALNHNLPPDIVVRRVRTVKASFHARFSAKSKTYRYRIWNAPIRPLFEAPFVLWFPHQKLSVPKMRQAIRRLVGKRDFKAFCDDAKDARSTVRLIRSIKIAQKGSEITLDVTGDGFLKHMVRIIAGTLLDIGRGKTPASTLEAALQTGRRSLAGPTAKAHALTLLRVRY